MNRPADDDRAMLAQWLREAAPSVGPHVASSLLPAIRFGTLPTQESDIPLGASKFGGSPDLPRGSRWPGWRHPRHGDRPMAFFAQINLADVAATGQTSLDLPSTGLLSFFADFSLEDDAGITGLYPWEQGGSTVLFTPAETHLERIAGPTEAFQAAQLAALNAWTWSLAISEDSVLPDDEFDALDGRYERVLQSRLHAGYKMLGRHQLGGHARFIQHPVEEEVVQALAGCFTGSGPFDAAAWERAKPQVNDWRLLLQLDSDDSLDVMWGDVGTLYWAATVDDIAAQRWDRGMFNFQCS